MAKSIDHVTVIGAGTMGSGVTQVIAQSGKQVILVDENEKILTKSRNNISSSLQRIYKKKLGDDPTAVSAAVSKTLENISLSTDAVESACQTDLVIEAIFEDRHIKKQLFKKLDEAVPAEAIFATNTSSFLIHTIAEATNRRDRFAGLHFFYPVPMMKLLEIIVTPDLSTSHCTDLQEFGKSIGKVCVTCRDTPGFIVNRLLIPYVVEAALMAERGDAKMEDIDTAMKLGCGYPMGPFQLMDFAGVDIIKFVTEGWVKDYPDNPSFKSSKLISDLVKQKLCGVKTGRGFYDYGK